LIPIPCPSSPANLSRETQCVPNATLAMNGRTKIAATTNKKSAPTTVKTTLADRISPTGMDHPGDVARPLPQLLRWDLRIAVWPRCIGDLRVLGAEETGRPLCSDLASTNAPPPIGTSAGTPDGSRGHALPGRLRHSSVSLRCYPLLQSIQQPLRRRCFALLILSADSRSQVSRFV
jgi:hypothetical protein